MKEINKLALIGGSRALSGSIIWPFIGFALYEVYHFSLDFVSLFYIIQGVISVLAYIIGGYMTDFLGRVKSMVISSLSASISLLLAFLLNLPLAIVFFILLQTFFNSIYNVSNTSMVGDLNKEFKGLVISFSRIRVGINAGWAIGPVIGGILFTISGFRELLLVSSIISLLPIPLLFSLPDFKGKIGISLNLSKEFILFLIPTFLTFMIMGQLGFSLLTYYNLIVGLSTFQVSLLFMVNGLLIVIFQEFIGRRLTTKMIILGMIIYAFSYLSVAFVTNFILAVIDIVFITLAEMIVSPLSQAIASSLSRDEVRGREIGIYGMVTALGRVLGSSYAGFLMNYYLYSSPLILWFLISLLGFFSALLYYPLIKRDKNE
ncbi:MFS transporter [Acidianus ambivalens]|uniref:MFS transporter n=1 Tax=Acidianus ambivalens TaxID=2283 RepID=A0A650CUR9_ACIAM|nr:MFS transporter [Acidianus ambivalens]MQL56043.1 MFS transporter [Acidianus ambivalens]QGR21402.1 MFS transporter [Acidianus ambivalens]